jgi:DNA-binding response OmpR family regulator
MERVLVVDDELPVRNLVKLTLETEGFEVETAANGREALEKLAVSEPNLVVLDLSMPGMDGGAVMDSMRGRGIETPVLFLSACGAEEARLLHHAEGALAKPFDPDELIEKVKRLAA